MSQSPTSSSRSSARSASNISDGYFTARAETTILEMVKACRTRGWSTAVVSNAAIEDVAGWDDAPLSKLFDPAAFSCNLGAMKPDPRIYRAALQQLDVDASEATFVSDAVGDLTAAAAAVGIPIGIWATWFLDRQAGRAVECDLSGTPPSANVRIVRSERDLIAAWA